MRRGWHGGDYSKANGFLVRRAETASRLHKSAPQIFAATRISCAVDLSRPFNGSETRHEASPRNIAIRSSGVYLLFPERKTPGIAIAFYRGEKNQGDDECWSRIRSFREDSEAHRIFPNRSRARINFPEQFAERERERPRETHRAADRCEEREESWYIQFNIIKRRPSVFENPWKSGTRDTLLSYSRRIVGKEWIYKIVAPRKR